MRWKRLISNFDLMRHINLRPFKIRRFYHYADGVVSATDTRGFIK